VLHFAYNIKSELVTLTGTPPNTMLLSHSARPFINFLWQNNSLNYNGLAKQIGLHRYVLSLLDSFVCPSFLANY